MTTKNDPSGSALLPIKKKGSKEAARELPISLRPLAQPAARKKGRPAGGKKSKPKVITFKCTVELLAGVDLCVEALREWDPLASRGTVLRMALTSFLVPRGFLEGRR